VSQQTKRVEKQWRNGDVAQDDRESDDWRPDKRLPDGFPKFARDSRENLPARHHRFPALRSWMLSMAAS
jgi:hypothetical protein